jgi:branched-chain amino acid transport system permease protein
MRARDSIPTIIGLLIVVALVAIPLYGDDSIDRTVEDFCLYLALAQLWNLLAGYTGLVSVGQQAFVGIGGYVLFGLCIVLDFHPLVAFLVAGVVGAAVALALSPVVFRLHGPYFAVGTWVVAEAFRLGFAQIELLDAGSGISLPVSVLREIGDKRDDRDLVIYELSVAAAVIATFTVLRWLRSRHGLALTAIRDNEVTAASVGVGVLRTKIIAYVVAGCGASFVGALLFLVRLRISPDSAFSVQDWTAYVIFMVVIGGIGTIEGPIIGTILFLLLREFLSDLGSWYLMILGTVAIAVMLLSPGGVWGFVASKTGWRLGSRHWTLGAKNKS